jgi:hypothetical protein
MTYVLNYYICLSVTFLFSLACRPINLRFRGFVTKHILFNFKIFNKLFETAYFKLPD